MSIDYQNLEAAPVDHAAAHEALENGHYLKAARIIRQALAESSALDLFLLSSAEKLAVYYLNDGEFVAAACLYRSIVEAKTKVLGEQHPDVRLARHKLELALWHTGGITPRLLSSDS
ncbi:MAG TPA: hypothetical protein V6D22_05230 [Candidatus Obscuribacterales bacterium]